VLISVVAVISSVAARSVARALTESDRTAELERAYSLLAGYNQELEEAIGALQQVHARVANGDLAARAPTRSGDPLLQLAVSLNLTLDRLARSAQANVNLDALQQEISTLSRYLEGLPQSNLKQPAPTQQIRRLAPLAFSIDQLRLGILQAIQNARTLVERVGIDVNGLGQQVQQLSLSGHADETAEGQLKRGIEAANADTVRLHGYLSRFL
jgi:methyl-accepting chemotaxis protein